MTELQERCALERFEIRTENTNSRISLNRRLNDPAPGDGANTGARSLAPTTRARPRRHAALKTRVEDMPEEAVGEVFA